MTKNKIQALAIAAIASIPVLGAAHSAKALVIDSFTAPAGGTTLTQGGVGTTSTATGGLVGVIGGTRAMTITLLSANSGTASPAATMKANNADLGGLALSCDSGVKATFTVAYGTAGDLNQNFSDQTGIIVEVIASDLTSVNNSITLHTAGGGTSTAGFMIPELIGDVDDGGVAGPVDIYVPFSSFTAGVNFADVDQISFTLAPPKSADYTISFFATQVPESSAMGLLAPAGLLLGRRRRA